MYTLLTALLVLNLSASDVQIPIEDIRSITYDKSMGASMYINQTNGTKLTYSVSDIKKMTLSGVPEPTGLETIKADEAKGAQKFIQNGAIYVVKNGKIYTIKGEAVQ